MKEMRSIFLAGGGSEFESQKLDRRFVALLDKSKPLLYVPHAMPSGRHSSCLRWFTAMTKRWGVANIRLLHSLSSFLPADISGISGIYMGGGDTVRLLEAIRESDFSSVIRRVLGAGKPVYGGSAGAIVLGVDIRTAPEASRVCGSNAIGLGLLGGYSIACHFTKEQSAKFQRLAVNLGLDVIAIPEKSGLQLSGNRVTNYGSAPVTIFRWSNSSMVFRPFRSLDLD